MAEQCTYDLARLSYQEVGVNPGSVLPLENVAFATSVTKPWTTTFKRASASAKRLGRARTN